MFGTIAKLVTQEKAERTKTKVPDPTESEQGLICLPLSANNLLITIMD